ncbi:MAG: HAD family hydrolase [Ignavibacterium sp.]|nr:HAD family hydrolase [Ignavibacterium sp.]
MRKNDLKDNSERSITHFCFDMDGTLIDSSKTIFNSTILTLAKLGIKNELDEKEFSLKIGQHFKDIFDSFNIIVSDLEEFIDSYKIIYFQQLQHSALYPEVKEVLKQLKHKNKLVSLLTTKAQDQTEIILDHFNITGYFDFVMGRRDGIPYKPSPEPLVIICKHLNTEISKTIIIGDTELDIRCGKSAGSFTCGVEYGYRSKELLEYEQPDFIISSIKDVLDL